MLNRLSIKNFVIIDEIEVDFYQGFNVLTGETGAGKSILLEAIMQLFGAKTSKDFVRAGADSSLIQAYFSLRKAPHESYELNDDGTCEIIISKEILANGRSVSKVNGEIVTQKFLKELASKLVSFYGQDDKLSLFDSKEQLKILDAFIDEDAARIKGKLVDLYEKYKILNNRLEELGRADEKAVLREIDLLEFQMEDIDEIDLSPDDEKLEDRYREMRRSDNYISSLDNTAYLLDNDSDDPSCQSLISSAIRLLHGLRSDDTELASLVEKIGDLSYNLSEIYRDIDKLKSKYYYDEEDFVSVEKRLDKLNSLKKKYASTVPELLEYRSGLDVKLTDLKAIASRKVELEKEKTAVFEEYVKKAGKLSAYRKTAAENLGKRISGSLKELNFNSSDFNIKFSEKVDISADGIDDVDFMVRLNSGESYSPLRKVASGGEASRIMLAIQEELAGTIDVPVIIFDEIDSGISGTTALSVAKKLYRVSKRHQLILVSHSLQVALYGDSHYLIEKMDDGSKSQTTVRLLDMSGRQQEIYRLISAGEESDGLLNEAMSLLANVEKYKKEIS